MSSDDELIGSSSEAPDVPDAPESPVVGQLAGRKVVEAAMKRDAHLTLVVGPEGCGKTTYLSSLAAQGLGRYVASAAELQHATRWAFVDGAPPSELSAVAEWLERDRRRCALVALRGKMPAPLFTLKDDDAEVPFLSTSALAEVAPAALLPLVQAVAAFEPLTLDELMALGRRMARRLGRALDDETLTALARAALVSGRSGHELASLLARLPPGRWTVAPVKRERGRAKAR